MPELDRNHPKWKNGYIYAVRLLAAANRSTKELAKRLKDKGYETEIVESVIEELRKHRILNDEKLVRETVQWNIEGKRLGRKRIALELKRRGIQETKITEALESYSKDSEANLAKELAAQRWEKFKNVEPRKRRQRIYDFLIRRGFDFELVRDTVYLLDKKANDENI
jgi:regulatory protein